MRCQIIAELATNHGGDLDLARAMIREAAMAGADYVKTQAYRIRHLAPSDPQYLWLRQAELTADAHQVLAREAVACGVKYLTTVYHLEDYQALPACVAEVKIGHGEAGAMWWHSVPTLRFVSYPWRAADPMTLCKYQALVTVPIYPMPLGCWPGVEQEINEKVGWSDHALGIDVAKLAIARSCPVVEKHFSLPGSGRNQEWDMSPAMLTELRQWADFVHAATIGHQAATRWTYRPINRGEVE